MQTYETTHCLELILEQSTFNQSVLGYHEYQSV